MEMTVSWVNMDKKVIHHHKAMVCVVFGFQKHEQRAGIVIAFLRLED